MNEKETGNNGKKYPLKIILVGLPKVVMHVINILHRMDWAIAGDWLEVKRDKVTGDLTMTITIDFKL